MTGLTQLVRAPRFGERKDTVNDRCELARFDDLGDLRKLRAVRLRDNDRTPGRRVLWLFPPTAAGPTKRERRPFSKLPRSVPEFRRQACRARCRFFARCLRIVVACNRSARPRRARAARPDF